MILKVACKQKSLNKALQALQSMRKNAILGVLTAHRNLQNPLGSVYFCFMALLGVHVVCYLLFGLCWTFSLAFLKKCSRPSVRSIIFKASCVQNLGKCTSWPFKLAEQASFRRLFNACQNLKIHGKNVYFLFLAPVGKLGFALCALKPTFWKVS